MYSTSPLTSLVAAARTAAAATKDVKGDVEYILMR